uniref:Major facilitator superfamily (MFS) profile domain-containing protein n=1 Tax=Monopterus albus TaxID=43700 RepID=A0A3Q3JQ53_MONAL
MRRSNKSKRCGPGETAEDLEKHTTVSPLAQKWTLILFIGTCLLYCARMAMPICVVSLAATFHWSKTDSGLVLGGFFWGYCFTQILGGHTSDKVGGERVLLVSTALWALATAGTPLLAQLGCHTVALLTLARFLMGLLQGVFFPSLASICSQRVVEGERGFLMSTMNSGSHLGTLLAGGMGSLLLDRYGWESMFYGTGLLSALWALIVWQCLLKGTVTTTMGYCFSVLNYSDILKTSNDSQWSLSGRRWLALLKKPSVWAMVFAHMCASSTFYTLLSWLPTYFKESFPHATGWVYNVIPWLTAIPSALGGGYVSDFLINKGIKRQCQYCIVVCLGLSIKMFTSFSILFSGVSVNVQDLTPSCAGALFGLVVVLLAGYLIEVTLSWATVFSLVTLVNATGLGIFLIFGDARRVDLEDYRQIIVI